MIMERSRRKMTFEEIVKKAKQAVKKIDGSAIKDHFAIQIDIEGEGEGAFYIEASEGAVNVEPYEYYENDCKINTDAETFTALLSGKVNAEEAMSDGRIRVEGDGSKVLAIVNSIKTKPATAKAEAKKATAKAEAKKPAAAKKPATAKAEA